MTAVSLRDRIRCPATKAPYVRRLFDTIAGRYDLVTRVLSYGQDRRWKRRLVAMAGPLEGRSAADLACGTGDIAALLSEAGAGPVIGLDVVPRMIGLARARLAGRPADIRFVVGDMCDLPFPDASFDVVTTGYGLRNVPDLHRAVREAARVLRPGGIFLSLDFSRPQSFWLRSVYHGYLTAVGSLLGWVLHRDAETYRYIPESIRHYPGAPAVARILGRHGFVEARWHPVLGGLLAIHTARRRGEG
ncbi:MAG TPA: ubiquinone/menaquinone biosynthesis methyltransferase [Vicinamibacterales bacterium]|nr:ubiquinone/menaquinone biosynthesis methyltransferase [Vicinamibacterales bacterium]